MKTIREFSAPRAELIAHVTLPHLRTTAQHPGQRILRRPQEGALAHTEALERALASVQQELIFARQQVALLTKANSRLRAPVGAGEQVDPKLSQFGWCSEDAGTPDRPVLLNLAEFGLSAKLDPDLARYLGRLLTRRIRFRKGDMLYRVGDRFNAIHAIRTGSCKSVLLARDGQEQVAGYHMAGEIVGLDGLGTDVHECQATALEDTETCPLPFEQIENLARRSDSFRRNLHKLLSRESARARTLTIILGTMRAEQRLAVFLLDLSQRYRVRGYSSSEFVLRMTREEIGSYLGLKLETVSRMFSRFQRDGLIQVEGRVVKLLDWTAVSRIVDCAV